ERCRHSSPRGLRTMVLVAVPRRPPALQPLAAGGADQFSVRRRAGAARAGAVDRSAPPRRAASRLGAVDRGTRRFLRAPLRLWHPRHNDSGLRADALLLRKAPLAEEDR